MFPRGLQLIRLRQPTRRLLLLFAAGAAVAGAAVRPSFADAWAFGLALQRDYAARHGAALVDRLDSDAFRARIFSVFGSEVADGEDARRLIDEHFLPVLQQQFRGLDTFGTFVPSRVVMSDDSRALECVLFAENGQCQFLTLVLAQNKDGKVVMKDCEYWGQTPFSRFVRDNFMIAGARPASGMEPEDYELIHQGARSRLTVTMAIEAFARKDYKASADLWLSLPPEFKATRFWTEFREKLALAGEPRLLKQWKEEIAAGHGDPFMRYLFSTETGDTRVILDALNAVLVKYGRPPILRAAKAYWLNQAGRHAEALALARDVYGLNPYLTTPYVFAASAAVAVGKPDVALEGLEQWAKFMPVAEIDKVLAQSKDLDQFRASARYREWRAAKATPVSSP